VETRASSLGTSFKSDIVIEEDRQFSIDRIALSPNDVLPCRSALRWGQKYMEVANFGDSISSVSCETPLSARRQKCVGDFAIRMNGGILEVHNSCSTGWIFPKFAR